MRTLRRIVALEGFVYTVYTEYIRRIQCIPYIPQMRIYSTRGAFDKRMTNSHSLKKHAKSAMAIKRTLTMHYSSILKTVLAQNSWFQNRHPLYYLGIWGLSHFLIPENYWYTLLLDIAALGGLPPPPINRHGEFNATIKNFLSNKIFPRP